MFNTGKEGPGLGCFMGEAQAITSAVAIAEVCVFIVYFEGPTR